jgi:hypothetical protein
MEVERKPVPEMNFPVYYDSDNRGKTTQPEKPYVSTKPEPKRETEYEQMQRELPAEGDNQTLEKFLEKSFTEEKLRLAKERVTKQLSDMKILDKVGGAPGQHGGRGMGHLVQLQVTAVGYRHQVDTTAIKQQGIAAALALDCLVHFCQYRASAHLLPKSKQMELTAALAMYLYWHRWLFRHAPTPCQQSPGQLSQPS